MPLLRRVYVTSVYPTLRLAMRLLLADVFVGVSVRALGLAQHTGVEYVLRTFALASALQPPLFNAAALTQERES
jgi:hypothetical protein